MTPTLIARQLVVSLLTTLQMTWVPWKNGGKLFFANPLEWWDNRKDKRNPKYPDFKHKDTGEALWVEGRYNPPWVKSQLAILDERMGSLQDQDSRLHESSMSGDDFISLS